jgi:hypothetical protein
VTAADQSVVVCVCCGGIEDGDPTGGEVDRVSGLCITCQPCSVCGEQGGSCYEQLGRIYCDNEGRAKCPVHLRFEPCPTCSAYIAAGL